MTIKAKTVYTTSDGKEHASRAIAQKHEAAYKVKSGLETAFVANAPSRIPSEFAINMLNSVENLTALRDLCNKGLEYHRNYGKLKKA
ncbi:hypothetical protein [Stenotrophomonas phage RAS14]